MELAFVVLFPYGTKGLKHERKVNVKPYEYFLHCARRILYHPPYLIQALSSLLFLGLRRGHATDATA